MFLWKRKKEIKKLEPVSRDEYYGLFPSQKLDEVTGSKRENAFRQALDTRKFEIELYWKRAAYFWTFIGAAFAGFAAIQNSSIAQPLKTDFSIALGCLGLVFSFAWYCVNRGSKHWQENWENHVDLLEDDITGPLYKIVTKRPPPEGLGENIKNCLTGPMPLSVSKINQLISVFVTSFWLFLLYKVAPSFTLRLSSVDWSYTAVFIVTAATCISFFVLARTDEVDHTPIAAKRTSTIKKEE